MRVNLSEANANNFMLFPEISIPLRDQGIVFLGGGRDVNESASNGSGKTTVCSLTPWLLWDKILRNTRTVGDVISYDAKDVEGVLLGDISGEPFEIYRARSRSGNSQLKVSFAGSSRKADAQAEINRVFGTFELAQNTILLGQQKAMEFMSPREGNRRKIMEDLLKLDKYRNRLEVIKQDLGWASQQRTRIEHELEVARLELKQVETEMQSSREQELAALSARISMLRDQLAKEKSKEYMLLKAYKDSADREKEYQEFYYSTKNEVHTIESDIQKSRTIIDNASNSVAKYNMSKESLDAGICPTCRRPLDDPWNLDATSSPDLVSQEDYELACQHIEKARTMMEEDQKKLAAAVASFSVVEEDYFNERRTAQLCLAQLDACRKDIRRTEEDLLRYVKEQLHLQMTPVADLSGRVESLKDRIAARVEAIGLIKSGIAAMEYWRAGYGSRGMPSMKISQSLPSLVEHTNEALALDPVEQLVIDILPGDADSEGYLMDKLTFLVWEGGREKYLEDCSAGQRRRVVIAMFLGLTTMQSLLTGVAWNIRFIDELFDELDAPGIDWAMRVLHNISDISTKIITSHRTELKGLEGFDHQWRVERGISGSKLMIGD